MTELLLVRLTPGHGQGIGAETLIARIHKNEPYFFLGVQPMVFQIKINGLAYLQGPPPELGSSA